MIPGSGGCPAFPAVRSPGSESQLGRAPAACVRGGRAAVPRLRRPEAHDLIDHRARDDSAHPVPFGFAGRALRFRASTSAAAGGAGLVVGPGFPPSRFPRTKDASLSPWWGMGLRFVRAGAAEAGLGAVEEGIQGSQAAIGALRRPESLPGTVNCSSVGGAGAGISAPAPLTYSQPSAWNS